jgi:hypothetical protein
MQRINQHRAVVAVITWIGIAALATGANGATITLNGLGSDYHVTRNGSGVLSAQSGIGGSGRLGTFRETAGGLAGTSERRGILQFDLASLAGFESITSATFSIYAPEQNSSIQTHDVDLWGSANRVATRTFSDAGATDEYASADYSLIAPEAVQRFTNPNQPGTWYNSDITVYLQARFNDFLNNGGLRYVFLRTQIEPTSSNTNSFYEFSSGESANGPEIVVNGLVLVPLPPAGWAGLGGLAIAAVVTRRRLRA